MDIDLEYFEIRAEEERQAARRSSELGQRERHLELARRYHELRNALAADQAKEDA